MPAENRGISFGETKNDQKTLKQSLTFFFLKILITSDFCIEKYKKTGQKIAAVFHLSKLLGLKSLHLNFALIKEKNLKSQRLGLAVSREQDAVSLLQILQKCPSQNDYWHFKPGSSHSYLGLHGCTFPGCLRNILKIVSIYNFLNSTYNTHTRWKTQKSPKHKPWTNMSFLSSSCLLDSPFLSPEVSIAMFFISL